MELAQPVERVREQEIPYLVAAEVEDERAPVGMRAPARVTCSYSAVPSKRAERELVAREVRRHPVQDHADAGRCSASTKAPEVVGLAEAETGA